MKEYTFKKYVAITTHTSDTGHLHRCIQSYVPSQAPAAKAKLKEGCVAHDSTQAAQVTDTSKTTRQSRAASTHTRTYTHTHARMRIVNYAIQVSGNKNQSTRFSTRSRLVFISCMCAAHGKFDYLTKDRPTCLHEGCYSRARHIRGDNFHIRLTAKALVNRSNMYCAPAQAYL